MSATSYIFFFNDTATTEIYTLSLHDALPISAAPAPRRASRRARRSPSAGSDAGSSGSASSARARAARPGGSRPLAASPRRLASSPPHPPDAAESCGVAGVDGQHGAGDARAAEIGRAS